MRYISRKAVVLVVSIFFITVLTFLAFHILPGDPAQLILGTEASEEKLEALRVQLGTNQPLHVQYLNWIRGFVTGDFGTSIKYGRPVSELLAGRLGVTAILGLMVMAVTLVFGILLGVLSAGRNGKVADSVIGGFTILGMSVPGFFLSILFMWIFGLVLHLFAPGKYVDYHTDPAGFFHYMLFPALAIAIPQTAILIKYIRAAVIDELSSDYVRTAKGKGVRYAAILYRHVLKNAIVAIVPLIGMMIGEIFSGSIIIEQVFGIPGVGRLLVSSVLSRDFPLTQTLVVYVALLIVVTNFLVDIVIQFLDPRISITEGE